MKYIVKPVFSTFICFGVCIVNARYSNRQIIQPMIIGGTNAERNQFPHIVSLQHSGNQHCGGSILSSTWVVTAAHCCDVKSFPDLDCSEYVVVAGLLNQGEKHPDIQNVSVAGVVQHPGYYLNATGINNDISLLKLASPLKFTHAVKPIRLPSINQEFQEGWAVGWGTYKRPSLFPTTLQCINMQVVNNTVCQEFLDRFDRQLTYKLFDTMVCAMPTISLEGTCHGDSGGPLSYNETLIGVVSWGVICSDYHLGAPSIFTAVNKYLDFIKKHIVDLPDV